MAPDEMMYKNYARYCLHRIDNHRRFRWLCLPKDPLRLCLQIHLGGSHGCWLELVIAES